MLQATSYKLKAQNGYIALMSAIVISVLLLAITTSIGFNGFFTRFNILDSESKERSLALAEACVDTAILSLAQDASYNPSNQIVNINADQCTIISITTLGSEKIIKTRAIINKSYSNLEITIDNVALNIVSWQEVANY